MENWFHHVQFLSLKYIKMVRNYAHAYVKSARKYIISTQKTMDPTWGVHTYTICINFLAYFEDKGKW